MSRTGLQASPTKKIQIYRQIREVHLRPVTKPAPYTLKPYAGLYNPYPYGCSLLCNHPIDNEARDLLQKAKHCWNTEGRNLLLAEEIDAIKAGLKRMDHIDGEKVDTVPEELFRRYTETDSRPLTPAVTLASVATKASASRRCVTPEPAMTSQIKEKTLLVLDLRRSHSQETLSWYGSSSLLEPPLITIQKAPTRSASFESTKTKSPIYPPKIPPKLESPKKLAKPQSQDKSTPKEESDTDSEEYIIRRGKKRRKKRDRSMAPIPQTSVDPETQITQVGNDAGENPTSAGNKPVDIESEKDDEKSKKLSARKEEIPEIDSFLDWNILKELRRELDETAIENEFNDKMKIALQEAFKTVTKNKVDCEELAQLRNQMKEKQTDPELFLNTPRIFVRSHIVFEFPADYRALESLLPLDYVRESITIISSKKYLYRRIFNKFYENEEDLPKEKFKISAEDLDAAIDILMGRKLLEEHKRKLRQLLRWKDEDLFDFRTFCGICALCERIFADEYSAEYKSREDDPPHEVELADFQGLQSKLYGMKIDEGLLTILNEINNK